MLPKALFFSFFLGGGVGVGVGGQEVQVWATFDVDRPFNCLCRINEIQELV